MTALVRYETKKPYLVPERKVNYSLPQPFPLGGEFSFRHYFGLNYFIKGQANKVSVEFTFVDQKDEIPSRNVRDHVILTFQLAAGF